MDETQMTLRYSANREQTSYATNITKAIRVQQYQYNGSKMEIGPHWPLAKIFSSYNFQMQFTLWIAT